MKEELNLNPQTIYDKQFAIEFKGYSAEEVDAFLDLVIQDYQKLTKVINDQQTDLAVSLQNNAALKSYIVELEAKLRSTEDQQPASATDILKRLSRLEALMAGEQNKSDT